MSAPSTPGHIRTPQRQVWFLDTSALVTLGVHEPLQHAVKTMLFAHHRVLVNAVVLELEGLASTARPEAVWAKTALGQLDWLGDPVPLDDPVGTDLALEVQEELSAGRGLRHSAEHYGESAIIAMASRARTVQPLMLSDDYSARVAANAREVRSFSIHRVLHMMIRRNKISSVRAAEFAAALHSAGRSPDYTAAELASGCLGRVGRP